MRLEDSLQIRWLSGSASDTISLPFNSRFFDVQRISGSDWIVVSTYPGPSGEGITLYNLVSKQVVNLPLSSLVERGLYDTQRFSSCQEYDLISLAAYNGSNGDAGQPHQNR
ncbi:MAG: hypothetical protein L6Q98_11810 [Anaerolineae bacterium]|nr:hypothetical protein [Anaerolineae bacterium]NUQ04533.1 hypothetical protein [Anaerolineae bacterium]